LKQHKNYTLYEIAKQLSRAFQIETDQHWNVLITSNEIDRIGLNFPRYIYDSQFGICIGTIGTSLYRIYASIIGFEDQNEEELSNG
jgi:hypothetical protein